LTLTDVTSQNTAQQPALAHLTLTPAQQAAQQAALKPALAQQTSRHQHQHNSQQKDVKVYFYR